MDANMSLKREFLVVYDYGTGGVWGLALACDSSEIKRRFPELKIVENRPAWMDDEQLQNIRATSQFVVSDPSTYPEWVTLLDKST